jgi:hypothetical protein
MAAWSTASRIILAARIWPNRYPGNRAFTLLAVK